MLPVTNQHVVINDSQPRAPMETQVKNYEFSLSNDMYGHHSASSEKGPHPIQDYKI